MPAPKGGDRHVWLHGEAKAVESTVSTIAVGARHELESLFFAARLIHEPDADCSRPGYGQGNKIEFQLIPASVDFNPVSHLHGSSRLTRTGSVLKEVLVQHLQVHGFGAESLGFRTRRWLWISIGSK